MAVIGSLQATHPSRRLRTAATLAAVLTAGAVLSSCQDSDGLRSGRAYKPIPVETLALMSEKGMTKHSPILLRAFKKEAELEIWKMKADGQYALLKTYPMCRWSGQLGPKRREGDRQVPEGFYAITPARMNPNSAYYLSFDVGYPNAFDRAHGGTGSLIMVHGACSSAGCFSMTDEQIAEIYAVAREAFGGGQPAIQMQSMPFRMTPENLAKHRFDPNMKFWHQIKEGSDHFEVTHREPQVAVCGNRYVFNSTPKDASARLDSQAACPPLEQEEALKNMVAEKNRREQQKVAELVAKGTQAVKVVYADGGQHPSFRHVTEVSRPGAVDRGPVEIAIDDKGKPIKTPVMVAGKTDKPAASAVAAAPATAATPVQAATASTPAVNPATPAAPQATAVARSGANPPASAAAPANPATASPATASPAIPAAATAFAPAPAADPAPAASEPFYRRWLGGGSSQPVVAPAAVAPPAAQAPVPPTPPKRDKQANALPMFMHGAAPALPPGFFAYSPGK